MKCSRGPSSPKIDIEAFSGLISNCQQMSQLGNDNLFCETEERTTGRPRTSSAGTPNLPIETPREEGNYCLW